MFQRYFFLLFTFVVFGFAAGAQSSEINLSQDEIEGLLLMREEEKLARDVYLTLGEMWNLRIFHNIAESEQVHMNHMEELLGFFNISDPVKSESDIGDYEDLFRGSENHLNAFNKQLSRYE